MVCVGVLVMAVVMPLVIVSFVPFPAGMQFRSGHPAVASFGVDQGIRGHPFAQTVQFLPLFFCAGLVFEAQQVQAGDSSNRSICSSAKATWSSAWPCW